MTRAPGGSGEHADNRSTQRVRVLCVEDDEILRDGLCRRLEDKFDVSTAGNGVEALEIIRKEPPFAVVLSDLDMPDMNGIELLSHVKGAVRIILSGSEDVQAARDAINVGRVHRFLTKPCSPQELLETIEEALATVDANEHDPEMEKKLQAAETELTQARGLARIGALARNASLTLSQLSLLARGVVNAAEERTRKRKPLEERDLRALNELAERLRRTADSLAGFSVIAIEEKAAAVDRASHAAPPSRPAIVPGPKRGRPGPPPPRTSRHTMDPLDLLDDNGRTSEFDVDVDEPVDSRHGAGPRVKRRSSPPRANKPRPARPSDPGHRR